MGQMVEPEDGPAVTSPACRTTSDQLKLCEWISLLSTLDMGKKEAVALLQDQTLRFPMTKVTASHLSAVWNTLIERLDVSEMFSVGFWFLEQIGKDATKDLGLCYCFVGVYRKNPSQLTSVAKELYKKVILGFPAGYQECLWLLSSAFSSTSVPLDTEQVTLYVGRLVKLGVDDLFVARAITALLRLGVLERTARKPLMSKVLKVDSTTEVHLRLIGALIVNGCGESSPLIALSVRKYLSRTKNPLIIQGYALLLTRLSKDLTLGLLQEFLKPSEKTAASSYFTEFLISTAELEKVVEATLARLGAPNEPFDAALLLGYALRPEVLQPWSRLTQSGKFSFSLPIDAFEKLLAPETIQRVAILFKASFKAEQDTMSALSRTFALTKTAQVIQESFESRLVLLDAALESIAEKQSDPLYCPFGTLELIYEWACQINCSSLFPSIYRLYPGLFKAGILESMDVSEQVECLYAVSMAGHNDVVKPLVTSALLSGHDKFKVAHLLRTFAPELATSDLIFSAMSLQGNSDDITLLFSALLNSKSAIAMLSRFALVPKSTRNDQLFLESLIRIIKYFASSKLSEKDSIYVLETVQDLILPYFADQDHVDLVVIAMTSLCSLGDRRFRSDLLASLIAKVVEGRHTSTCSTYIRVLASIPGSEPITVIGILTSLAKEQTQVIPAVESLALFIMERSQEIESLLPEVAGLIWTLVNERCSAPLGKLCLALAEALGTDLANTALVHQQILVKVVCLCLEEQVSIYGTSSDTDDFLSTCTRIILLTKSFPRPDLLMSALSLRLSDDHPFIALDCFRWLIEFCPEQNHVAFDLVFPRLIQVPNVPLDLILLFSQNDRFVERLLDQNAPVQLLTRLIPKLDLPSLPSSSIQDLTMRSFQRAMESLSAKDQCLAGLSLAESLIDTLHSLPDTHNPASSALTPYQPLIFTIFGLATGNSDPLVRSYGYLALCRLCSVDFYGLGVAEHPRIDRLLSLALNECGTECPDRLAELSESIMAAAWSYILLHDRFNAKFPLVDKEKFARKLSSVVKRTRPNISGDYSFEGSDLVFGYSLGIRCALALQHMNGSSLECTAVALMGRSTGSIRLLLNSDLSLIQECELHAYLMSYKELSVEFIRLAQKVSSGRQLVLSKIDIDTNGYSDDLLFALFEYLSLDSQNSIAILGLISSLLDSNTAIRVLLQCLKSVLPHLTKSLNFENLIALFLSSKDESGVSLQLLAYALTFRSEEIHLTPSVIKSSVNCLLRNIENSAVLDCAILILCKAKDLTLRRAIAVKILPRLSLSESRKKLLVPALQDIL